jgi:hypothetical protein
MLSSDVLTIHFTRHCKRRSRCDFTIQNVFLMLLLIKNHQRQEKRAKEEAKYQATLQTIADMSPETIAALRAIKTYKFYPYHPLLNTALFTDDSINQYFGRATQVSRKLVFHSTAR